MLKKRKNVILFAFVLSLTASLTAADIFADKSEKPVFPVNENGQTYGSDMGIESLEDAPDLILIRASNGRTGYASKKDLSEVEGNMSAEEAAEITERQMGTFKKAMEKDPDVKIVPWHSIPVYESDGKTVIGEYVYMYSPYLIYMLREDGVWINALGDPITDLDNEGNPVHPDIEY